MDILRPPTHFARLVGDALEREFFTLVDVGCGGGLDDAWRAFGPRLRALGLDSDGHEMQRLQAAEGNPHVQYRAAMIDGGAWAGAGRDPWARLAIAEWKDMNAVLPAYSGGAAPAASVEIASTVALPEAIAQAGFDRVDFLKMDVDGPDFGILCTLDRALEELDVLGVGVEVNFIGSGDANENSFHNTDRWLRRHGFDLFDLSTRRYCTRALPGRTRLPYPAETHIGRLFQGDAVYFRDLCAPAQAEAAAKASPEQLAKLAALYSLFGLPDCAAEVLVAFRARLEPMLDVAKGLDLLAAEAQGDEEAPVSFDRYMQAFREGDRYFRLEPGAPATLRSRAPPAIGAGEAWTAIDPSRRVLHGDARCDGHDQLLIRTAPGQWSYGVEFPLDRTDLPDEAYLRLVLEAEATVGAIGVGLLNRDRVSFSEEAMVQAGHGPVRLEFLSPRADAVEALMVRNFAADGRPSDAALRFVEIVRF
jgi:hypothetical protein